MTAPPASPADERAAMMVEGRRLAVDVLYSEKGHFAAARAWRSRNYWLGIPASLIGAAAGATILASAPAVVAGTLALPWSALTALMTFLNSSERAAQHQKAGVAYSKLRRTLRQFVQIDMMAMDTAALRANFTDFTNEIASVQGDALPIPNRAYQEAVAAINSGSGDYTDGELDAATGAVTGSSTSALPGQASL